MNKHPFELHKTQRFRDPIHDLIVFDHQDPLDRLAWKLLNTPEFQRLRRIRQLGFSEFVFTGATHTRFAHSIGVFQVARRLMDVLENELGERFDPELAKVAACAALLHDIGHGPFSHTFESVQKKRNFSKSHEKWSEEIIRGDTQVNSVLKTFDIEEGTNFVDSVGDLLTARAPRTVYDSIVSSQLDADRLDYMLRDQHMTGADAGLFDFTWLLESVAVDTVPVSPPGDEELVYKEWLVLTEKGLQTAESYLLGRYHLYSQVYMHKTTRAAEKMLSALLFQASKHIKNGDLASIGLPETHPVVVYFGRDPHILTNYLALDDMVVWTAISQLMGAKDQVIAELATRLYERRLFKCLDIGAMAEHEDEHALARFRLALKEALEKGEFQEDIDVLEDLATVTAYGIHEVEDESGTKKILIRRYQGDKHPVDVANISSVLAADHQKKFYRTYARTPEIFSKLESLWKEAKK